MSNYVVQLAQFEGPLSLLLHLIKKEDMDIYNIEIHKITGQYLDYIRRMKEFNLEIAGEFITMAATLIHIKSLMLLPQYDENNEEVEVQDPRKELVQRLLEYQAFKEVAERLYQRPLLGRDIWGRARVVEEEPLLPGEVEITLDDPNALYALISSYRKAIRRLGKNIHRVAVKMQSVASRVAELREILKVGNKTTLWEILPEKDQWKSKILITFLSLLELSKLGYISIFQSDLYGNIYIDPKKPIDDNVIVRTEEYDVREAIDLFADLAPEAGEAGEVTSEQTTFFAGPEEETEIATDEEILAAEQQLGDQEGIL